MKNLPIYPFLFAIYPVVFLLQVNQDHVELLDGLRLLVVALLLTGLVYWLLNKRLKDRNRSALLVSLGIILFFSYGHVYTLIKSDAIGDFIVGRHRYLFTLYAIIFILGARLIVKRLAQPGALTGLLTAISAVLVLASVGQIGWFEAEAVNVEQTPYAEKLEEYKVVSLADQLDPPSLEERPDIYLIVFDSYPREDFLLKDFQYDNRPFLEWLEGRGFYIPECQMSNYAITTLSISALMQMDYVGPYGKDLISRNANWTRFGRHVVYSPVRRTLEDLGYNVASIETDFTWLNLVDASHYYTLDFNDVLDTLIAFKLNAFEQLAIDTSALRVIEWFEARNQQEPGGLRTDQGKYYRTIESTLDVLDTIPEEVPGPKFVYVHVAAPHWPFVFDENGNFKFSIKYSEAVDEILYLNKRMQGLVETIQEQSGGEAIILLQADHSLWKNYGEDVYQRMLPFSAYYLPEGGDSLYPNITTVNLFRVIFNEYFGGQFELLEDISYHSPYEKPYQFIAVTDPKPQCVDQVAQDP